MVDILSKPSEICENIFGDAITEDIGRILASVCNGEIDLLLKLIENTKANEYARGLALIALVVLVYNGQLSRGFVMDYFKQLMNGKSDCLTFIEVKAQGFQ
jgi:predicted metal-dependent RNase